jgi:hypothetical protein
MPVAGLGAMAFLWKECARFESRKTTKRIFEIGSSATGPTFWAAHPHNGLWMSSIAVSVASPGVVFESQM